MALSDNIQPNLEQVSLEHAPVIAMVAGEASGDTLGADLIASFKHRYPNARFVGIGGPKMIAQGFESWYPMEKLSVMGFFEVLKHLFELLKIRKELIKRLSELKPDVFIGIDAPDFNFKIEASLKQQDVTAVHYVGPSVWAWREKRLEKIKRSVDGVLVLFPFEPDYYDRYQIPVQFVGHPLAHRYPLKPDKYAARKALNLPVDSQVTALLPGSRMSEIDRMADVYIQAARKISEIYPHMLFIVPCVHEKAKERIQQSVDTYGANLNIHLFDQSANLVLAACDQVIVTSGTATLESALMKRPMVLAIKLHPITHWIMRRLATTKWVGLPNVLAGESIVTELIQDDATPEKLALHLGRLVMDESLREKQIRAFEKQHLQLKQNASEIAVDAIKKWADLP
ncbi:lipid-A-disaccharide synthase [Thiomicrorhabdus sp. ZW0627]|uniref:lipid-A-disaccharide synthase n=1 Tax=Thiomicrorhabdus sp. ZW0627 TaxID=3039774 RepID=UPI002436C96F|nr:lipid-A-disaccharide synthase [Thiomicrorhabdus sp. ZW0627]MDG6772992.1 lipid-A-disaccharide synthase [Thiomicrorhabdus sp. ZW0627]